MTAPPPVLAQADQAAAAEPPGGPREMPRLVARDEPASLAHRALEQVLGGNPIGLLWTLLSDSGGAARQALRSLLKSLIEEGERFGLTPAGQRWREMLEQSSAVHKGWLLWNHANLDFYLRNAPTLDDTPAALLQGAWLELERVDIAAWLAELSRLSSELDAGRQAQESA